MPDNHTSTVAAVEHHPRLAHQFDNMEQQREAASVGMWVFLSTEVMFFGGLFLAYLIYRQLSYAAFAAGSTSLDIVLGTTNTAVLICSSLTMAMAVHAAQVGRRKALVTFLLLTMLLGTAFLGIKGVEYHHSITHGHFPGPGFHLDLEDQPYFRGVDPGRAQMFFSLYFAMTGMHALHMVIGLGLLGVLVVLGRKGRFSPDYHAPVENIGLYWHFVDIVWIFLFPLLYLISRHH